jgi:hypothetical protein
MQAGQGFRSKPLLAARAAYMLPPAMAADFFLSNGKLLKKIYPQNRKRSTLLFE